MVPGSDGSPAPALRDQILATLAPHLLAAVLARSERASNGEQLVRRLRDHFEVRVAPEIAVQFSIDGQPERTTSVTFDEYYFRPERPSDRSPSVLYVRGETPPDLFGLDGDGLGVVLAPLFLESPSGEVASVFPRIASRVQSTHGDPIEIRRFLNSHLAVSFEAQDHAAFLMFGDGAPPPPPDDTAPEAPPPPPVLADSGSGEAWPTEKNLLLEKHRTELEGAASRLLARVSGEATSTSGTGGGSTADQREQGLRGEDEIKRRLEMDGGWGGMTLTADKRRQGCGYDFLCLYEEQEVKVEVKTFAANGRLMFTALELQEAASSEDEYFLVGVLSSARPPYMWRAYWLRNPIVSVLSHGNFRIDARLQVAANSLFELHSSQDGSP